MDKYRNIHFQNFPSVCMCERAWKYKSRGDILFYFLVLVCVHLLSPSHCFVSHGRVLDCVCVWRLKTFGHLSPSIQLLMGSLSYFLSDKQTHSSLSHKTVADL